MYIYVYIYTFLLRMADTMTFPPGTFYVRIVAPNMC
jgi:hypothetical protein